MSVAPLILTLGLHPEDQARFDALREAHFPSALNYIQAHLTLFHHLPGEQAADVAASMGLAAAGQAPFEAAVRGVRSLGRGVAFTIESAVLTRLRGALARHWHDGLTAQDRQGWRPHITVQNKVTPAEAASLLAAMEAAFTPFSIRAEGLALWRYLGGPWELAGRYAFSQEAPGRPL